MDKISTFTQRLKEAMSDKGFNQADLVRATGIERSRISFYCSGRNNPKPEPLEAIAKALGVNPVWLMGYDVPKTTTVNPLIEKIEQLNDTGKNMAEQYINFLLTNPQYRKSEEKTKIA